VSETPTPRTASADPFVADLREQITRLDHELLAALNRRLSVVRALHEHKSASGIPLRDPEREASLLDALVAENPGPLSAAGVRRFFEHLIDLVRQELHGPDRVPADGEGADA
jgi:chorismate mutase